MVSIYVRDVIFLAAREYEMGGYACARNWPGQGVALLRLLGDLLLGALDWHAIEAFKLQRVREGKSRSTINNELAVLSKGLSLAVDAGYLSKDARPRVKLMRVGDNARQGFVYPHEFLHIWLGLPPVVQDIATLAYASGWRKGEVTKLTWDLVQEDWIRIRDKKCKTTKAAAVVGPVKFVISRRRLVQTDDNPLVFHRGGKAVHDFRRSWKKAVMVSGLGRAVLFHDLRRSFINNGRRARIDRKILMEMSGHRTHSVFDRYEYIDEEEHQDAARRIHRLTDLDDGMATAA